MNQVVVHTKTGQVIKGTTNDFLATKDRFHLVPANAAPGTPPQEILMANLKAVFFVKSLAGHPEHIKRNALDPHKPLQGRKIQIIFHDGETMLATTQGYQPGRMGFFVVPVDPDSNNERCFILSAATRDVSLL